MSRCVHASLARIREDGPSVSGRCSQVGFYEPDFRGRIEEYVRTKGGVPSDLIEPSDGFHPNQLANELLSEQVWSVLETSYPRAIGDVNPHNAEIENLFDDQGGF